MGVYEITYFTLSPLTANDRIRMEGFGLVFCCLMTPGLSKDIRCHV